MLAIYLALAAPTSACATSVNWVYAAPPPSDRMKNTIRQDGRNVTFNGAPVADGVLHGYFVQINRLNPRPLLVVDTRGMDCAAVERIQKAVADAGGCPPHSCFAYEMPYRVPPPAPPFRPKRP